MRANRPFFSLPNAEELLDAVKCGVVAGLILGPLFCLWLSRVMP